MAKFAYTNGKEQFAKGAIDWTTDDIRVLMVKSTYAQSSGHAHLDSITGGNRIGTAVAITTPTAVGGLCTCDPVVFLSVAGGNTIRAFVFYKHTGVDATSDLIAYVGEDSGAAVFNISTNGSNVTFTPNAAGVLAF